MKYPENRLLFTVKEVSRTCGVSRSTLIRMEESGFLTPYLIDPETGYRYYDADNIAAIGQFQLFQELGLSKKEISDIYFQRVDSTAFFAEQKAKLTRMSRLISQLELRMDHSRNFASSFVYLPEIACYCEKIKVLSMEHMETYTYELYGRIIKQGFQVRGTEPLFVIADECADDPGTFSPGSDLTVCIPIVAAGSDPHIRTFPATRGFSMIFYGDYSLIPAFTEKYRQEIMDRGLIPAGPVRGIALVAPYTGAHYKSEDYCSEYVMPVKE